MDLPLTLADIAAPKPDLEAVRAEHRGWIERLDAANDPDAKLGIVRDWDRRRRGIDTWFSLVHLRFQQDTRDEAAKVARDEADALSPQITECTIAMKRRLLADPDRPALEQRLGRHVFQLWQIDVGAFDPTLKDDLEAEAGLTARYQELLAAQLVEFDGKSLNLAGLRAVLGEPDRTRRQRAAQAFWDAFSAHAEELDRLFDDLIRLRSGMAAKLGHGDFIPLGYQQMRRVGYDQGDVAAFRDQVAAEIVPLAQTILERRRHALGLDRLSWWDEAVGDPSGNPRPIWGERVIEVAAEMFERTAPALGAFFRQMAAGGFLDLETRPGKAGGGFCTSFPSVGAPFIFSNFTGSSGDLDVLTHEIGHAFQNYSSRHVPLIDLAWPTSEAAEIHSMALEFLVYDALDGVFGSDAERYRRLHLEDALLFLPYGVAVDHFQHLVYHKPDATSARRHQLWREVEARYLPWRDYGDLAHPAKGGFWQQQRHIYCYPFYYIDYTLASCCALQFWARSRHDAGQALADYIALCSRGGTASFADLVVSAGLASPFRAGALSEIVAEVKRELAL